MMPYALAGLLGYEDKVGKYWPEFSKHGKRFVTIAEVMRHEGGVPFFADPKNLKDVSRDRQTCFAAVATDRGLAESLVANSGLYVMRNERTDTRNAARSTHHFRECVRSVRPVLFLEGGCRIL